MADDAGSKDRAQETLREAEIAKEIEQAVRAGGSGRLIAATARLSAKSEDVEARLSAAEARVAVLEAAIDALAIPMLRGLTEGLEPPPSVTISADMPLDARDGFHWVEHPENGDPYRWTGANGGEFRFVFLVDRSADLPARLVLGRRGPGMDPKPDSLDCLVDGRHVRATATAEAGAVFEFTLPSRPDSGLTQLVFSTATGPADGEGDRREIGVPFRSLTVGLDEDG